jgi:endonuclease/exonuclease/phosphatase (EEP) superfamily protein YafD
MLVLTVLCWLLVLAGLVCLLARNVVSTRHVLVLAATALPLVGLACLLPVLVFLATRRWIELAISVLVVLGLLVPLTTSVLNFRDDSGIPLRIMTLNMRLGEADADQIVTAVRTHQVTVLMLQEFSPAAQQRLESAGLDLLLGYHYLAAKPGSDGAGIYSADPLSDLRSYPGFNLQVLSATIAVSDSQQVTVFSSHVAAPWPQQSSVWKAQSALLGQILASTSGTIVDAGDFNATISHKVFRDLVSNGKVVDAARDSGTLTLPSFPADRWFPPLFGIDHVLLRNAYAKKLQTIQVSGSDHRAVLATLTITS